MWWVNNEKISYKAWSKNYDKKEGISAKCIPNLNKGSEIIEFTTREGKLTEKKRPSSYLLKELNVKFIDKSKSRATDVV